MSHHQVPIGQAIHFPQFILHLETCMHISRKKKKKKIRTETNLQKIPEGVFLTEFWKLLNMDEFLNKDERARNFANRNFVFYISPGVKVVFTM